MADPPCGLPDLSKHGQRPICRVGLRWHDLHRPLSRESATGYTKGPSGASRGGNRVGHDADLLAAHRLAQRQLRPIR
jgi:hypothetical protein